MPSSSKSQDVIVIGGGPAGSTVSSYLAMKGHSVTVLEKEKFPRDHVGESLLPFCYQVFDEIGVLDEMKRRYVRKPGVRFIDVDGQHHTTWCFGHVIKDESYLSFHVIRAEFDQMLLENSRRHGVTVKERTRVTKVDLERPDGGVEVSAVGPRGGKQTYRARFLIDASGRDTFLAKRKRWKKPHPKLDRSALSTHWIGGKYTGGIQEGLLQIVYLGGGKKGWIWVIPVGTDRLSVGVVVNHSYIRKQKAKFEKQGVRKWREALYRQELSSSEFVADVLADAEIAMPIMFNGDYSYSVDAQKKYGSNFALIGDASTFIDPIFASGVYLSINTARLVSEGIHQRLASSNGEATLAEAYSRINGAYALVDKAIQMFYNPTAINFAQAGSAQRLIHDRHENALAIGHYLLAGDFFERHEEYSEFIDLLQDPSLLEKYKAYVIDRPEFQSTSCGSSRTQVFHELLNREAG